jgi:hypothetical protein
MKRKLKFLEPELWKFSVALGNKALSGRKGGKVVYDDIYKAIQKALGPLLLAGRDLAEPECEFACACNLCKNYDRALKNFRKATK